MHSFLTKCQRPRAHSNWVQPTLGTAITALVLEVQGSAVFTTPVTVTIYKRRKDIEVPPLLRGDFFIPVFCLFQRSARRFDKLLMCSCLVRDHRERECR